MRNFVNLMVVCGLSAVLFPAAARAQYPVYYTPVATPAPVVAAPVVVNRYSFYTPVAPAPVAVPYAASTTVVQRPILRPRVTTTYYYAPAYTTGYYAAPVYSSYYLPPTTYYYAPGYYSYYYTPGFFRY
jgi:hypothetical protein